MSPSFSAAFPAGLVSLGVIVCASLLGGCDADQIGNHPEKSGALRPGGNDHALCLSTKGHGSTFTEGFDTVVNLGTGPVHVDRAEWLNNHGLKVREISVFRRGAGDRFATFGEWIGYPPQHLVRDGGPSMGVAWARRVPAEGATLPVTDQPHQHYFDVLVSFTGARGSAGPLRLSYTDAEGHPGTVDTLVTVKTRPTCS